MKEFTLEQLKFMLYCVQHTVYPTGRSDDYAFISGHLEHEIALREELDDLEDCLACKL